MSVACIFPVNSWGDDVLHPPLNSNEPLTISFPFSPSTPSLPIIVSPVTLSTEKRVSPLGQPLVISNFLLTIANGVASLNASP